MSTVRSGIDFWMQGQLMESVSVDRQLLSWYAVCQNPSMSKGGHTPNLSPLWVRCDMADSEGTAWLGAETIRTGDKATAVKLHTFNCKGQCCFRQEACVIRPWSGSPPSTITTVWPSLHMCGLRLWCKKKQLAGTACFRKPRVSSLP